MKRISFIVLLSIIFTSLISAQNFDKKWGLNIDYGSIQYRGELGDQFLDFSKWQSGYGIEVSRYLSPSFNVGFRGGYNYLSVVGPGNLDYSMNGELFSLLLNLEYKFSNGVTLPENGLFRPYIKPCVGMIFGQTWGKSLDLNGAPYNLPLHDIALSVKGGTKVKINKNISAFLELGNLWVTAVGMDGSKKDVSRDQFIQLNLGLSFTIGALRDADRDGVGDKADLCPQTPRGIEVDVQGCPLDNDGDGIPNFKDKCIDMAGSVETQGCPDIDSDGIADIYDHCPNDSGPKSNNGCPVVKIEPITSPIDVSNIGISEKGVRVFYVYTDNNTAVPTVYSSSSNEGMAYDEDGDGISDNIDICPTRPGVIENYGCPANEFIDEVNNTVLNLPLSDIAVKHGCPSDIDCDGISDDLDKCPNNAGAIRNLGCPIEKLKPQWKQSVSVRPAHFMSGKTFLTDYSRERVDQLISIMNNNPTFNVWMFGHTDASGPSDINLRISEQRIQTIVDYLISKGIARERIFTMGLGESFPASLARTENAQLMNRRVEFYLFEFK